MDSWFEWNYDTCVNLEVSLEEESQSMFKSSRFKR